jgi:hypothetical protein
MLHAPVQLRSFATGLAMVLGLLATWIIGAEATRPDLDFFPTSLEEARSAAWQNQSAATAAWLGWPRGDLWSDYAVTANAAAIEKVLAARPSQGGDTANDIAETAAVYAPSDARAWLLQAAHAQAASNVAKTTSLLKMSYYTSPYSDALFPVRIRIATRSPAIVDDELASFVEYELGVVVGQKPALGPAIAAAYRSASPDGRRFFDRALAKLNEKLPGEVGSRP